MFTRSFRVFAFIALTKDNLRSFSFSKRASAARTQLVNLREYL